MGVSGVWWFAKFCDRTCTTIYGGNFHWVKVSWILQFQKNGAENYPVKVHPTIHSYVSAHSTNVLTVKV